MDAPSIGIFLGRPDRGARLAAKLRTRGFPVVHYNHEGFDGEAYVPVAPRAVPAVAHVLFRTHHDIYLTGLSHVPGMALYLNRALRGRPYVFNETSLNWDSFADRSRNKPFPRLFERFVHPFLLGRTFAGAAKIVCNSHFLSFRLAERFPHCRERVTTIHNGIDLERYRSGQRLATFKPRDVVIACVTTLNLGRKSSGLDLVLDAFGRVHDRHPEVRLAVAAKFSDPAYLRRFETALDKRAWRDCVIVYRNHPRVADLLASADLFVYATPSGADSLPRALLEAQAAGLPAVATNTCGCSEVVGHNETGLLAAYDPAALAGAILELVEDPDRRRRMGAKARERTAELFSWDAMADGYARLFEAIAR